MAENAYHVQGDPSAELVEEVRQVRALLESLVSEVSEWCNKTPVMPTNRPINVGYGGGSRRRHARQRKPAALSKLRWPRGQIAA